MRSSQVVKTAVKNTFRSKLRTFLTALAIFVGAFTLTLTNGVGAGISNYIDTQLDSIGGSNVMNVLKVSPEEMTGTDTGPKAYDPDKIKASGGSNIEAITDEDIDKIRSVAGVESVRPVFFVSPKYIGNGEKKFEVAVNTSLPGENLDFTSGSNFTDVKANQIILPTDYVAPLGFSSDADAVGKTIEFGVEDVTGALHSVTATVTGVQKPTLIDLGVNTTESLRDDLYAAQTIGLPASAPNTYVSAQAIFSTDATAEEITAIKDLLKVEGFFALTVEDQVGMFKTIVDIIIGVLNGFAVIALVAAGFGIINTLLMSVQERTREIGLMKAMGLGSGKIFAMFSVEAVFIGFLGSAVGAIAAVGVGTGISKYFAGTLGDLGEVQLILFEPMAVGGVILTVMVIAFLAGTLPAASAAKQNPIDALRYE